MPSFDARRLAWLLAATLLLPACGDKSDREKGSELDDDSGTKVTTESFTEIIEGTRSGGASSTTCRFTFKVALLPEDADDVTLDVCTLAFKLNDEVGEPSMEVSDPDGTTSEPDLPTLEDPTVELDDFLGAHVVDGLWQLEFGNLGPCDDVDGVSLELSGSYTLP